MTPTSMNSYLRQKELNCCYLIREFSVSCYATLIITAVSCPHTKPPVILSTNPSTISKTPITKSQPRETPMSSCRPPPNSAEAVEPSKAEPPRPTPSAMAIDRDVGAKVAAADILAVEERHFPRSLILSPSRFPPAFPSVSVSDSARPAHKVVRLPFLCTWCLSELCSCFSQHLVCLVASSCRLFCSRTHSGSFDTGRMLSSLPASEGERESILGGRTRTISGWPFLGLLLLFAVGGDAERREDGRWTDAAVCCAGETRRGGGSSVTAGAVLGRLPPMEMHGSGSSFLFSTWYTARAGSSGQLVILRPGLRRCSSRCGLFSCRFRSGRAGTYTGTYDEAIVSLPVEMLVRGGEER